jgi:NAD(P)H-dependent FMN reductase
VSSNTAVVRAAAMLAPADIEVLIFDGLSDIPPFNPDLDRGLTLVAVSDLRSRVEAADAVLISSPEYAHGVSGVLKNALDWLVGSGEFIDKPVAIINASPHSTYAQASLTETLRVMSAHVVAEASVCLPLAGKKLDESGIVSDTTLSVALLSALVALARAVPRAKAGC